jgi:hypothetical protein
MIIYLETTYNLPKVEIFASPAAHATTINPTCGFG